jgi:hypothetical protein
LQEDGLSDILEEDGCSNSMYNAAGSQYFKEKPENNFQVLGS